VGAVEAAAELAAFAANAAWRGGRQADADAMIVRGESLVSDRDRSPARAALLAEKARLLALRQDLHGNGVATAALEAAEALGLDELRANALNTLATLTLFEGRFDETEALYERAIDAAPPGSSEIARAAANSSIDAFAAGDMERSGAWVERALEAAGRAGERPMVIWAEYCQIWFAYYLFGRWDEAMTRISALVSEVDRSGGHYLESRLRAMRAGIEAVRSDPAGASLDVERAASMIEDSTDPQFQVPLALELASALLHLDRPDEAAKFIDLAADGFPRSGGLPLTADMATAIASCGRGADFLSIWEEPSVLATPRGIATKLLFSGQVIEAADAYARIDPEEEAAARLFAAQRLARDGRRDEAEGQLQRGLPFFRAVGASKIVRDAEGLSAASSS
jgi:tetratricopeptide (TPR) repeat protein